MQKESSTIAAVSTPLAVGGIGVIRVSGPEAHLIAEKIFRPAGKRSVSACPGYSALFGRLFDRDGEFDEAVVTVFRAPHSYTGEDVAEISCHGGVYLVRRALRALIENGAEPAAPGEFTKRAFLNGKLSLTQAEAVMDLIGAQGEQAARAALTSRDGALYRKIGAISERLAALDGHLAAWVDYPEEEIEEVEPAVLERSLGEVLAEGETLLATFDGGKLLREGVDTVIAGSPNVGKSTLMNLLAGCEKSIVTDIPGTTRDVVEEAVRVGDVLLRLADTAGLRRTDDPVETAGVSLARRRLERAGLVLAVFDSSRPLEEEDRRLLKEIAGRPAVAVINKSDLPPRLEREEVEQAVGETVWISAARGSGVEELSAAIARVLSIASIDTTAAMIANERQRDCLLGALSALREALSALAEGQTLDAVGVCVEEALQHLGDLTGERAGDLVIEQVFSRFCVGK
ncbi:MAG: tRNA uridine-5-carboxymethylaminomethyl(34) synthesis GTPase MnmE [Oscillospiraceae bacterium]|nr:tRNA uridine-5-carboxymethylaminomethyl(34) synthesis GTPase MnmE [Oscillospiraceae bacterium]